MDHTVRNFSQEKMKVKEGKRELKRRKVSGNIGGRVKGSPKKQVSGDKIFIKN